MVVQIGVMWLIVRCVFYEWFHYVWHCICKGYGVQAVVCCVLCGLRVALMLIVERCVMGDVIWIMCHIQLIVCCMVCYA